jgi:hypothetical protein
MLAQKYDHLIAFVFLCFVFLCCCFFLCFCFFCVFVFLCFCCFVFLFFCFFFLFFCFFFVFLFVLFYFFYFFYFVLLGHIFGHPCEWHSFFGRTQTYYNAKCLFAPSFSSCWVKYNHLCPSSSLPLSSLLFPLLSSLPPFLPSLTFFPPLSSLPFLPSPLLSPFYPPLSTLPFLPSPFFPAFLPSPFFPRSLRGATLPYEEIEAEAASYQGILLGPGRQYLLFIFCHICYFFLIFFVFIFVLFLIHKDTALYHLKHQVVKQFNLLN